MHETPIERASGRLISANNAFDQVCCDNKPAEIGIAWSHVKPPDVQSTQLVAEQAVAILTKADHNNAFSSLCNEELEQSTRIMA